MPAVERHLRKLGIVCRQLQIWQWRKIVAKKIGCDAFVFVHAGRSIVGVPPIRTLIISTHIIRMLTVPGHMISTLTILELTISMLTVSIRIMLQRSTCRHGECGTRSRLECK